MNKPMYCPFCGEDSTRLKKAIGRRFVNGLDEPIEQHKWYVQCQKCKARGSIASGKVNLYDNFAITPEKRKKFPSWQTTDNELMRLAIRLWNIRCTD